MCGRFRPHSWRHKFAHAFRGLRRAIRTQSSFAIHFAVAAAVGLCAAILRVSSAEWCLLVLAVGLVLAAETFNTAMESLARVFGTAFHPRLRDALDMASAAVLLAACTAVAIGLIVFLPRLFELADRLLVLP